MNKIVVTLMLLSSSVMASETKCMTEIMYSEAQGEPITGLIAVGEATLNRADNQNKSVCKITGVTRKAVPSKLKPHYTALANGIISNKDRTIGKADSWDRSKRPRYAKKIIARIGNHTFYKSG